MTRRLVLVVTGGVAAYKAAYLARLLIEAGDEVRVAMTDEAHNFIGPTTFASITQNPVVSDLFESDLTSPHTDLGGWADAVIVAPATAATLARLANGLSEEVASATLLATRAPVLVAPAMHTEMWEHPATQRNIEMLRTDGITIVGPAAGALAGGDQGIGRMAEPEEIVAALDDMLAGPLTGLKVLVTAGGTREAIDPVRFIGNRSSGRMGHAIADVAAELGAHVTLVTTSERPSERKVTVIRVESAQEMADAVSEIESDVVVMAAAVADFRPAEPAPKKLKRVDGPPQIELEPTPDIIASIMAREKRPFVVGFAAESEGLGRAVEKARRKGTDLTVANDITEAGAGFGHDTNRVSVIDADGRIEDWPLESKTDVARRLWNRISEKLGR